VEGLRLLKRSQDHDFERRPPPDTAYSRGNESVATEAQGRWSCPTPLVFFRMVPADGLHLIPNEGIRLLVNEGKFGGRSPVRSIQRCQQPDRRMFTKLYSAIYVVTGPEWVSVFN